MGAWVQVLLVLVLSLRGRQAASDFLHRLSDTDERQPTALFKLEVNETAYQFAVNAKFISFSMDHLEAWRLCNQDEIKDLAVLAKMLSPAELRLGGEHANFMDLAPSTGDCSNMRKKRAGQEFDPKYVAQSSIERTLLTGDHLLALSQFAAKENFDLAVDFSSFKFLPNGLWDSSNAHQFLDFTDTNEINITSFTLGHEPEKYGRWDLTVSPENYTAYYMLLRGVIKDFPRYKNSRIYGPDVANLHESLASREFLHRFLKAGAPNFINEVSVHHYNCDGRRVTARDFLSPVSMNGFKTHLQNAASIVKVASSRPLQVRLTETASCSSGGAPGLSTNFISGFMWLDKLGVASSMGVTRLYRNSLIGGNTALIGGDLDFPFTDFLIAVAFKNLVDGPVLEVKLVPPNENVRVYANCARPGAGRIKGDVVFYFLNLAETAVNLTSAKYSHYPVKLYLFTPGDEEGLTSSYVRVNGKLMEYRQGVPRSLALEEARASFPVEIPGNTYGFMTITDTQVSVCKTFTHQPELGNDIPDSSDKSDLLKKSLSGDTKASSNDGSRVRPGLSLSVVWCVTLVCLHGMVAGVRA